MMKKTIYTSSEHKLPHDKVDVDAIRIIDKLQAHGYLAYLVGGGVRDLLLGHEPKDFDISTSARPDQIKSLFGRQAILVGRRFQLAHVRVGRKLFEVSTFRKGGTETDDLITHDNEWGSAEEDVLRRDFTINGLLYHPETREVIDFVGGLEDLQNRTLKVIGAPYMRFRQDPVRMLRLIKFKARFDLSIPADTIQTLCEIKHEILKSSSARVLEEVLRMLQSSASYPFFKLLGELGFTEILLPNLATFIEQDREESIFHFLKLIDSYNKKAPIPFERALILSALFLGPLQKHLELFASHHKGKMHLGIVQQAADQISNELTLPFLRLPRKLASQTAMILTNQFRLISFEGRAKIPQKLPKVPEIELAMQLLAIRAKLCPDIAPTYKAWKKLM